MPLNLSSGCWRLDRDSDGLCTIGVTVWELLTYGAVPYVSVSPCDLVKQLKKGVRPLRPPICTAHVYRLMTKCWRPDPERRPTFTELAADFAKMLKASSRYLMVQCDGTKKSLSTELVSIPQFPNNH